MGATRRRWLLASASTLLLALGCGAGEDGRTQPETGERPIRVIAGPYLSYAPLFVAHANGYFEDEGLTVELVSRTGTPNLVPALLTGDIDVVPEPASPGWLNAIERGGRIRIVSGKGFWDPDACSVTWILAHQRLFEDGDPARELAVAPARTHRISQNRLLHIQYMIERALGERGVELDRLHRVDIPTASEYQGFLNGSLSLSLTSEPWLTRILDTGSARRWIAANEVLPGFQFSFFIFGPGMLDERPPEVGAAFLRAYLRGVRAVARGKTVENIRILAEATQQEEELLRRTCWPSFRPDGQLDTATLNGFQRWLHDKQLLDRVLDPSELWDPRFLEMALDNPVPKEGGSP